MLWLLRSCNSHWVTSFTGGFDLEFGAHLPNAVKSIVFLVLTGLYVILFTVPSGWVATFATAASLALFVLLLKLVVLYLNSRLDEAVEPEALRAPIDAEPEGPQLPSGISIQL
jgi:hypothetical protein